MFAVLTRHDIACWAKPGIEAALLPTATLNGKAKAEPCRGRFVSPQELHGQVHYEAGRRGSKARSTPLGIPTGSMPMPQALSPCSVKSWPDLGLGHEDIWTDLLPAGLPGTHLSTKPMTFPASLEPSAHHNSVELAWKLAVPGGRPLSSHPTDVQGNGVLGALWNMEAWD